MDNFVKACLDKRLKVKEWKNQPVKILQEKKNGYFLSVIIDEEGMPHIIGKKENYTDKFLMINQFQFIHTIPPGTCIFGEMYLQNKPATDVITALNEGWNDLRFCGFAIPFFDSNPVIDRPIGIINNLLHHRGIEFPETRFITDLDTKESLLQEAIDKKYEGWVLKESHLNGWYKLKPVKTVDVVILEWEKSWSPQFFGELGALRIGIYKNGQLVDIGKVGGGFTPQQRKDITVKDIGRVIEVDYQDVQSKGGLQFPRFIRFRDDKSADQCTEEQLI